jgi:hypothetical protein
MEGTGVVRENALRVNIGVGTWSWLLPLRPVFSELGELEDPAPNEPRLLPDSLSLESAGNQGLGV